MSSELPRAAHTVPPVVWVLIVVAVGLAAGFALAVVTPSPPSPAMGPPGPAPSVGFPLQVFFSGLDVVLLLALVIVYVRTYAQTRARFALGLVLFLAALLLQVVLSSPAFFRALGYGPGNLGFFFLLGGVFEAVALSVFLYLSLE
jgi:hypothetical protein